jgi:soluble lytic murein transglycosylase-like protein
VAPKFLSICLAAIFCLLVSSAWAGPVYVFKEADGTTHFSSVPPAGKSAKVFTAERANFSYYSGRGYPGVRGNAGKVLFKRDYNGIIAEAAKRYEVAMDLVKAVIHVESAFNPYAISPKGALGLMQLMPENVRLLGVRNPFSPEENINAGVRLLAMLIRRFNGDQKLVLAAYNAGAGAVEKYGGVPPYAETIDYVWRVLSMKGKYKKVLYE